MSKEIFVLTNDMCVDEDKIKELANDDGFEDMEIEVLTEDIRVK